MKVKVESKRVNGNQISALKMENLHRFASTNNIKHYIKIQYKLFTP